MTKDPQTSSPICPTPTNTKSYVTSPVRCCCESAVRGDHLPDPIPISAMSTTPSLPCPSTARVRRWTTKNSVNDAHSSCSHPSTPLRLLLRGTPKNTKDITRSRKPSAPPLPARNNSHLDSTHDHTVAPLHQQHNDTLDEVFHQLRALLQHANLPRSTPQEQYTYQCKNDRKKKHAHSHDCYHALRSSTRKSMHKRQAADGERAHGDYFPRSDTTQNSVTATSKTWKCFLVSP